MTKEINVRPPQSDSGKTSREGWYSGSAKNLNVSEKIFGAFAAIYGHKFISQYPSDGSLKVAKKFWEEGLSNLTIEEINRGIDYCLHTSENLFPPSLPEFRKWCMPTEKELGIPDIHEAYKMAMRKEWAHPIIFHVIEKIGSYEFRQMSYEKSFKKFSDVYKELIRLAIKGEKFLLPPNINTH